MTFKINPKPQYEITVNLAGSDEPLTMTVKRMTQTERSALLDAFNTRIAAMRDAKLEAADADDAGTMEQSTRDIINAQADFLSELVTGWSADDAEYTRDNLAHLLDSYDDAFDTITKAYREGGKAAALGN